MSEETERWFDIRAKFKLVSWDELEEGQKFWYYQINHSRSTRYAAGPFTMVNKERCRLRNPQGVEVPFLDLKGKLQPMIFVATDNDQR